MNIFMNRHKCSRNKGTAQTKVSIRTSTSGSKDSLSESSDVSALSCLPSPVSSPRGTR